MRMNRWGFLGLGLAVVLALAGCASSVATKRSETGLELDLKAGANEGHAILRVISLRPNSMVHPKWQRVELVSNGQSAAMVDVTVPSDAFWHGRHFATEALYFAKLPAGKYDVSGFGSLMPNVGLIVALLTMDNAKAKGLPSFTVEAGRLANLGTLVFSPAIGKDQPPKMVLLQGPLGRKNALETLLSELAHGEPTLPAGGGWLGDGSQQNELKVLAQARQMVSQLYERTLDQGLVAGSHLGQVLQRTGRNAWTRESVDTLDTIFTVGRTAQGLSVAGSEYGTYFVKSAQGIWQPSKLPGDKGRVVYVEPYGKQGVLLGTVTGRTSRFWVRDSMADPKAAPREVAKLDAMLDSVISTPSELIVAKQIYGLSRESEIMRLDKTSFAVTTHKHGFWVREWQRFPDGEIRMTRQNFNSFYRSSSGDGGKSWAHEPNPGGISTYWMNQRSAYSLDWQAGFIDVTNTLQKTTDGGGRWQSLGTPLVTESVPGRILHADSSEIILQTLGIVYSTQDEGKTWVQVLPPKP